MKTKPRATKPQVIALALTWDGARCPVRTLPPKARAFLAGKFRLTPTPSPAKLGKLFAADQVNEIRVCFVPRLKGGADVLSAPFPPLHGKRLAFIPTKRARFGDILAVIYRRRSPR
jgi:hypothetical protein